MSFHLPPPTDHRSALKSPPVDPTPHRRPLTPSSLRDVNLSPNSTRNFNYPSPPTGHDLMAMFPPTPPPVLIPGPTSGYFHTQERAFFSRAGDSSLFRVQIDIDTPIADTSLKGKTRAVVPPQRQHSGRAQTIPINTIPVSVHHHPHAHPHPHPQPIVQPAKMHITNHIPPDVNTHPADSAADDSWKRPTPYSERRRGKQTKRRTD